jgi:hypothetical protein
MHAPFLEDGRAPFYVPVRGWTGQCWVLRGSADAQWTVVSPADQLKVSGVKPLIYSNWGTPCSKAALLFRALGDG